MKRVRRLREAFVEVPCAKGSTKAPWRVHEASSRGPWKNFVGFLRDDACSCVNSVMSFLDVMYLAVVAGYILFIDIARSRSDGLSFRRNLLPTVPCLSRDLLQSFYARISGRIAVVDDQFFLIRQYVP